MATIKVISKNSTCSGCCYSKDNDIRLCKFPKDKNIILSKKRLPQCVDYIDDNLMIFHIYRLIKLNKKIKVL